MTNNFEIIKPLLTFDSKDDFYFLQVIQRKKDAREGQQVSGTNNNSRLIRFYCIKSIEHLERVMPEIIKMCDLFNARAGIDLGKKSFKKVALRTLTLLSDNIANDNLDKIHKVYSSACGKTAGIGSKRWIIDIDQNDIPNLYEIVNVIENSRSYTETSKIIARIPSKTGLHLITSAFDPRDLKEFFPNIDVQKRNPTNLYIP